MQVLTRSYNNSRTGYNPTETSLTPDNVGSNILVKRFSLNFNDDPRLEAQPLYIPGILMNDGKVHDVVYICTMANNIWAFDAQDGTPIWAKPANIGNPVSPRITPRAGFPTASEIDMWGINILWGILSTPVIDLDTKTLYVVNWSSPDGTVNNAIYQLHAIDITTGKEKNPALTISASAPDQVAAGAAAPTFLPSRQKQRPGLLLTKTGGPGGTPVVKTLFMGCGMTHEVNDPTHGWVIAFDLATFRQTAAWCTTPGGTGAGIWQAGQGLIGDTNGDIYFMSGNYGVNRPPAPGDLPESMIKLRYTPPADATSPGRLQSVAWFTPFQDSTRDPEFQDNDLASSGAILLPELNLMVGAGKDGVLYVLNTDDAQFGQGSNYGVLKAPPIFITYFPGFGIDAANVANLDRLYDGKTHHLHSSPTFWVSPIHGPMLLVWGENETLRAWTISPTGTATFLAKSAEIASAGMGGVGGMPGGFPTISSNGAVPKTGIVWATAPISQDANKHVVPGIIRAYDAETLDPVKNADGTSRLKLLWDSNHIPGNTFNHNKFCPPIVADGQVYVPTYDGRVDVYGLTTAPAGPLPTNAMGF